MAGGRCPLSPKQSLSSKPRAAFAALQDLPPVQQTTKLHMPACRLMQGSALLAPVDQSVAKPPK